MKKYIKEAIALALGVLLGILSFMPLSKADDEFEPLTISLNSSSAKGVIQFYYTTDSTQEFSNDQMLSTGEIAEGKIELQLNVKHLHKLRMDLGSNPGEITLQGLTLTGDRTVKIENFNKTEQNDIENVSWEGDKAQIKSTKEDPYIEFQTPFNLDAKVIHTRSYIISFVFFIISALIIYLIIRQIKEFNPKKAITCFLGGIATLISSTINIAKSYAKEVIALAIGLACGIAVYIQKYDTEGELTPITVALDCSSVVGGIHFYYTTDSTQTFTDNQVVGSNVVTGDNRIEFLLNVNTLHKLRMDVGSFPGVISLKNITITGDRTVKITNFDNTTINQIQEVFWYGDEVQIRSLEADPYVIFETPFNINAKVNHTNLAIKSVTYSFIAALIAYLLICVILRLVGKKEFDFKVAYMVCMLIFAGIVSIIGAKMIAEKIGGSSTKNISISARLKTQNAFNLSFFHTTKPDEEFNADCMTIVPLVAGENEINVTIPTRRLEKLRVDFGSNPGEVKLESLTVHGSEDIELKDEEFGVSLVNELDSIAIKDGSLLVKSTQEDPWVVFSKTFNLVGDKTIIINKVIFVTLFFTLLLFLSFGVKTSSRHVEGKKVEDIALVIVFITVCIVPTFLLTDKEVSESEKRKLAEFPAISDSTGFNSSFSTQFDTWYSDHFTNRDEIVSVNNAIFQNKGNAQNESVIEGEDGWLFFKLHNSIETYSNLPLINEYDLNAIKNYLLTINNWCNAHGKKFYFLICPNKTTIYGEKVKHIKKFQDDEHSDAALLLKYLEGSGIKVVFSKDELMKHKNDGYLLYRKHDTHHSEIGAYYTYKAMMDVISKDFPVTATPLSSISMTGYKDVKGCDLKQLLPGAIEDDTCTYQHLGIVGGGQSETGPKYQSTSTDPQKVGNLYILGDSFSIVMQYLFGSSFHSINVNRVDQYFFTDAELAKIEAESDIVILEVVERHLSLLARQKIESKMQPFNPLQMNAVK